MTRQGYQRIEFVLDISADPRDAEISDILASLPNLARSEFIRRAIYTYAHAPAEPETTIDLTDNVERLWTGLDKQWQEIQALRNELDWLRSRPAAAPVQPAPTDTVASSGLNMGGQRKPLKAGSRVETKEFTELTKDEQDRLGAQLLDSINGAEQNKLRKTTGEERG